MVRRTSLSSSRTPRRRSTPARLFSSTGSAIPPLDSQGSPFGGEVHFLPLRQVLDGRVKRRIRRNGLSEEMNTISAERRRRAEQAKAEMDRLKAELAEKDEEIEQLHDETAVVDTERVWELEQQVASLKKELASRAAVQEVPSSPPVEWAKAAHTPQSDNFMDFDIEDDAAEFGESTVVELECSTPTRRMRASFPTPPSTSPEPQPSSSPCQRLPTPRSSLGVQASLPDPEKQQLEEQLASLQLEVAKLTTTLESYSALTTRLSAKLTPAALLPPTPTSPSTTSSPPSPQPHQHHPQPPPTNLEPHLTTLLQTLSDRTAALTALNTSLTTLGFPGTDGLEVLSSLQTALRTARLELEYTTPGESTLPLTGAGAEVLAALLTQLHHLTKQNRDAQDAVDEYRALVAALREQLRVRVEVGDGLVQRLGQVEEEGEVERARYVREVARLEGELGAALARTDALRIELDTLVAAHAEEVAGLVRERGEREERVGELEVEVERVGGMLKEAEGVVEGLREENRRLGEVAVRERGRAEKVVRGMRGELERVMRMGEGFLSGSLDDEGDGEGGEVAAPQAERKSGRPLTDDAASSSGRAGKRRKYDSGLGLLDEEVDVADV